MPTTTKTPTVQSALSQANPNVLADAARVAKLGRAISPIKVTLTGLTSAASFDITSAAVRAAATVVGISPALETLERLPAIGSIETLRVVTGTATGPRAVTDAGGTATTGIALISDDGKTITFEAVITAFVITYYPRAENLLSAFSQSAP